jgi:putative peptidoglycan lipid II flippase
MTGLLGRALRYNVINALQIALTVTFQILLARTFGASFITDAYLISLLFVTFVSTMASGIAEMFVQYYHEIKEESPAAAARFYQAVLNGTLVMGLGASAATATFAAPLSRLIAPGFSAEQLTALHSVLAVLALGLTGSAAVRVNGSLLRAEMHFLPMYLLGLLTPALNVATILLCGAAYGIAVIAAAAVAATMIGLVLQQAYIGRALGLRWAPVFWHPRLGNLIVNSLLLRAGHQIWDFKDMVATSVLSLLPAGTVTLYFYGSRIITMAFALTSSAWLEMFASLASRLASTRNFVEMRSLVRRNLLVFTSLFAVALIVLALLLPWLLRVAVGAQLSDAERATIYGVFLALVPFYVIVSVESSWVALAIALKQGLRVAIIGAAFILIFWTTAVWLRPALGVYAVPAALAVAQMHNLAWYWVNGRRILQRGDSEPAHAGAAGAA